MSATDLDEDGDPVSVWAITMVKDEADIVVSTVANMAAHVDQVLVADNGSRDGTRRILNRQDCIVVDDPEPGYYQARKISALAANAAAEGADWIVPFDADEVWGARGRRIADVLSELPENFLIAEASMYDHVATGDDGIHPDPVARMRWRRLDPLPLPKVACRYRPGLEIHQGNHGATYPDDTVPPIAKHLLSIHHFPYRSAEQMIRKARNGAAAYAATDLPDDVGAHWRGYGALSDAQLAEVFREHFYSEDPTTDGLILDPAPRL